MIEDPILYLSVLLALSGIFTPITFFENDDDIDGDGKLSFPNHILFQKNFS